MTSDGDALLAAILAAPEEDTPRLVYADWLDEQGEHGRAEFIRVQCEMFRMIVATGRPPEELGSLWNVGTYTAPLWVHMHDRGKYGSLQNRERKLTRSHRRDWEEADGLFTLRPAGKSASARVELPFGWKWVRGFIADVEGTAANWIEHGDKFTARHPVGRVTLTTVPDEFEQLTIGSLTGDRVYYRVAGRVVEVPRAASVKEILETRWKGIVFTVPQQSAAVNLGPTQMLTLAAGQYAATTDYVACGSGFVPDSGWLLTTEADWFESSDLRSRRPYVQPANIRTHLTRLVPVGTINPPQPTVADRGTVFGPVSCHDNAMLMRGRCQAVLRDVAMDMSNYGPAYMRYEADVIGEVEWTVGVDGDDATPHGGGGIPV